MTDLPGKLRSINRRRVLNAVGLVLLVAVVGLFLSVAVPQLVGADQSFVVQSSSMSPSITAGSVVYVNDVPADRIAERDVITFENAGDNARTTHRVVEVVERDGQRLFRTKGDANEEPDEELVAADQIIGVVAFHMPLIGYVISFAQTGAGIVLFVVLPAVVLLALELRDLYRAATDSGDGPSDGTTGD